MAEDPRNDEAARRFRRSEADKAARLAEVRERLSAASAPSPARREFGWLGPALFWTGLIVAISLAASWWFKQSRGDVAFRVVAGGRLELDRGAGGHYRVPGVVGTVPVRFLVDSGASITAIPAALGDRLGMRACPSVGFDLSSADEAGCCRQASFSTANGMVEACVGRVPRLLFGPFEVNNVQVALMPDLGDEALLGMNVLKHFSLTQRGRTLTVEAAR